MRIKPWEQETMANLLRRLFLGRRRPGRHSAAILQLVMTGVGVFTFLAGVFYLPTVAPTRVETLSLLLLLAAVALLCHAVGQLAAILERLDRRADSSGDPVPGSTPDRKDQSR